MFEFSTLVEQWIYVGTSDLPFEAPVIPNNDALPDARVESCKLLISH